MLIILNMYLVFRLLCGVVSSSFCYHILRRPYQAWALSLIIIIIIVVVTSKATIKSSLKLRFLKTPSSRTDTNKVAYIIY